MRGIVGVDHRVAVGPMGTKEFCDLIGGEWAVEPVRDLVTAKDEVDVEVAMGVCPTAVILTELMTQNPMKAMGVSLVLRSQDFHKGREVGELLSLTHGVFVGESAKSDPSGCRECFEVEVIGG